MWKEKAIERLKNSGFKLTPQRMSLIEIISKMGFKHPSLKEIYEGITADYPNLSFSTLYSNLIVLKALNLIELFSLEGETRVEINMKPHFNIISSTNIEDFPEEELIKEIERKIGKKVKFINILINENFEKEK